MFSSKFNGFRKNEDCPSSFELSEYQNGDLSRGREDEITRHLAGCDFCSAESEFYAWFGEGDYGGEVEEPAQIPAPLFELAEALLKKRHADSDSLDSLLRRKGKLLADPV